jgi:hypothetical protein
VNVGRQRIAEWAEQFRTTEHEPGPTVTEVSGPRPETVTPLPVPPSPISTRGLERKLRRKLRAPHVKMEFPRLFGHLPFAAEAAGKGSRIPLRHPPE